MTLAELLRSRRFLPLFVTQAIGAFTDNAMKSAFAFLITFGGLDLFGLPNNLALTAGAGAFILPFLLFSGYAGKISDATDKTRIVRATRIAEIIIAAICAIAIFVGSAPLMIVGVFAYGTQSAFFGPSKYAILPQHLPTENLITANALFESSTFIAILAGTLFGGLLAGAGYANVVAVALVVLAALSYVSARFIPEALPCEPAPEVSAGRNFAILATSTIHAIATVAARPAVFRATLGISWFWALGLVVLTVFPEVALDILGVTSEVANLLIAAFVVGIAIGTALTARWLKGVISARHVPFGALGLAGFMVGLAYAASGYAAAHEGESGTGVLGFLSDPAGLMVAATMLGLAIAGGIFTVPLYAILQARSEAETRSSAIAGNSILNSISMVVMLAVVSAATASGMSIEQIFVALGIANVGVAVYVLKLVPADERTGFSAWLAKR